jgi:hypothetical protein
MASRDVFANLGFDYGSTVYGGSTVHTELRIRDLTGALMRTHLRLVKANEFRYAEAEEIPRLIGLLKQYLRAGAELQTDRMDGRGYVRATPAMQDGMFQGLAVARYLHFSFHPIHEAGYMEVPFSYGTIFVRQSRRLDFAGRIV